MQDYELINNPTYAQAAKVFKIYYPKLLICTNVKVDPWYMSQSSQWKHIKGNKDLIVFIDTYFTPLFEQMQKNVCDSINESDDLEFKKDALNKVMLIGKLIDNLKDKSFKENLCKELKFYYM